MTAPLTGRTLSHYRVHEEISRGGMGVVYRATDLRLNRDVALKLLPEGLTQDEDRTRRFVQEAQAASALEHPHIAVIHDIGEADGHRFIAMELIRGEKLSELLARQRLSAPRALELGTEIASGLARAHDKAIVHRDLKPANVMVTDEGHAKIIDFGLAKLVEPTRADTQADTLSRHDTGEGIVLGTAAYMSPEQARGERVDHRSDIFSFGILLHEALAGQPPFQGRSSVETASAILHQPAPRLPSLGPTVPTHVGSDIQRIVDKCLEKEPADRYQGMKDVIVDLRSARRHLESTTHAAVPATPASAIASHSDPATGISQTVSRRWGWAAAIAAIAITAAALWWPRSSERTPRPIVSDGSKPAVAVLHFDNASATPELDWLRTGITEMVVTDLSQSRDVEVIPTEQLSEALADLRHSDNRALSPDVIRAVAERTGASNVIVGSYVKAGSALRINLRVQDAKTGRILSSERVDGRDESSLFAMIDELTRRIQQNFRDLRAGIAASSPPLLRAPGADSDAGLDRGLGEVTTSSIEAYRHYAEGINLHERHREAEAADLFLKAIAIDPPFAMAHAKLAVAYHNLGRWDEREKHATLALQHRDRLTLRERYYIEGFYYSFKPGAEARAIDAFTRCVALNATDQSCRHNLALTYSTAERYKESIAEYEELLRRGALNPSTTGNLTEVYRAVGELAKSTVAAEAFVARSPDNASGYVFLGNAYVAEGRLDQALSMYRKAAALDPVTVPAETGILVVLMLQEQWTQAEARANDLLARPQPTARWGGGVVGSRLQLFRGRSADALRGIERAIAGAPQVRASIAHTQASHVLRERGELARAVQFAEKAVQLTQLSIEEPLAITALARAHAKAGRRAEADAALARATRIPDTQTIAWRPYEIAFAQGVVALESGDLAGGVDVLMRAEASLPAGAPTIVPQNPHVQVWHALGRALQLAGRDREAVQRLERVTTSRHERASWPIDYVRSFYFLGQLQEKAGDTRKALESYRRFVELWKDGDLDRDRVADAERKLTQLAAR
jgi:serine/threonine protein kinase/tetratricopeptide (TPR) repeat protein